MAPMKNTNKQRMDKFKKLREKLNLPIALLLDTKGPEIRTGKFEEKEIMLKERQSFALVNEDIIGDSTKCTVSYKELYKDVKKGNKILINDGLVELEVNEIINKDIHCTVLNGGVVGTKKGINVPGVEINLPSLTEQDVRDIKFGIENEVDFIAASFVRKGADIIEIRKILEKNGGEKNNIIAKIENRQGIDNFDEILRLADGVMVARGDLGVEIPVEEVPIVQKTLISKCFRNGKPVIVSAHNAVKLLKSGSVVTVDGERGLVYYGATRV